jgi:uncharacterized phiE125 gp8 family phage protein
MPLNSNALTSLSAAKDYLEIPSANTAQDARIERFINAASQLIEKFTSRKLKAQSYTEHHDGRRSNALLLREWPAQKPSVVCIDSTWAFNSADNLDPSEYDVIDDGWLMLRSGTFPRGTRNVRITYTAGFATVPADLEEACLMLVEYLYMHRNDRRTGILAKSKNGENTRYSETIPTNIKELLWQYVRMDFPHSDAVVENV